MKRKLIITIERKCKEDDVFCELVADALKEHAQYIENHVDEIVTNDTAVEFPLGTKGEMKAVNGCLLKWEHEGTE